MLKLAHLHYEKNWFSALFNMMKRVLVDNESGQPVMSMRQTWKNYYLIYSDPSFSNLILEARFLTKPAFEWDLFEAGKNEPFGHLKAHMVRSIMMLGGEAMTIDKPDGKPLVRVEQSSSALKRFADIMSDVLYNPTHTYEIKDPSGKQIGAIAIRHSVWKSSYDFMMDGGTEKEKQGALIAFAHLLIALRN